MIGSDYPDDYTTATVSVVTAAGALSETNNAEKITKTNALHAAYA